MRCIRKNWFFDKKNMIFDKKFTKIQFFLKKIEQNWLFFHNSNGEIMISCSKNGSFNFAFFEPMASKNEHFLDFLIKSMGLGIGFSIFLSLKIRSVFAILIKNAFFSKIGHTLMIFKKNDFFQFFYQFLTLKFGYSKTSIL